jgi:hypothetical protein
LIRYKLAFIEEKKKTMEKKALLKTAVVRFMLVAAMVLGAALLPGSLLSVRAETTQLPEAVNGTIKLTDGVRSFREMGSERKCHPRYG